MNTGIRTLTVVLFAEILGSAACKPQKAAEMLRVRAPSTLPHHSDRYSAGNMTDGTEASWCEGADGTGEGLILSVFLRNDEPASLSALFIRNGFGERKYWARNNRVSSLRLEGKDKSVDVRVQDAPETQELVFPTISVKTAFQLVITGVYRGETDNDTCIAEISTTKFGKLSSEKKSSAAMRACFNRVTVAGPAYDSYCRNVPGTGSADEDGAENCEKGTCEEHGYRHACRFEESAVFIKEAAECK